MAQVREWHLREHYIRGSASTSLSLIVANRSATSNCWQRHWLAGWSTFGLSLSGPSSQNWKYTKYTRYFRSSSSWFEYTSQSKILPSNVKTCILLWRICEVFSHQFPRICLWTATIICSYRLMLLSGRAIYIDAVEYFDVTFFWCSRLLLASSTRLSVSSLPAENHLHLSQPNTGTPHPLTILTVLAQESPKMDFCVSPFCMKHLKPLPGSEPDAPGSALFSVGLGDFFR